MMCVSMFEGNTIKIKQNVEEKRVLLTGKDGGRRRGSISKNLKALLESRGSGFTGGLSYGFTLSKSILIYDRTILVVSVQCSVHVFGDNLGVSRDCVRNFKRLSFLVFNFSCQLIYLLKHSLSRYLLVYLSTFLLVYLSTCLLVYLSTCLLVYFSTCLLVDLYNLVVI